MPITISKKQARINAANARKNAALALSAAPSGNVSDNSESEHTGNLTAIAHATVAKPVPASDNRREARSVAARAVAVYYSGKSLPFKSAGDKFADLACNTKQSTIRQSALFAVMLAADLAGNIKPDGTFIRGGFLLPLSLFRADASPDATVQCQPESGCLSDANGRVLSYVSVGQSATRYGSAARFASRQNGTRNARRRACARCNRAYQYATSFSYAGNGSGRSGTYQLAGNAPSRNPRGRRVRIA